MRKHILQTLWVVGVVTIAGFCLSACHHELDIKSDYDFTIETLSIPKTIKQGEMVEIRCQLIEEGTFQDNRYTLRYFQHEGEGILRIGKEGEPLLPNDRYPLTDKRFLLYYTSQSKENQALEVVIENSSGKRQTLAFAFNSKQEKASEP